MARGLQLSRPRRASVRLAAARAAHPSGVGLGLALCEAIARAHQGALNFTAEPSSTWQIQIPQPPQPTQGVQRMSADILLIEDDAALRHTLQEALSLEGYGVTGAASCVRRAPHSNTGPLICPLGYLAAGFEPARRGRPGVTGAAACAKGRPPASSSPPSPMRPAWPSFWMRGLTAIWLNPLACWSCSRAFAWLCASARQPQPGGAPAL